MKHFHRPRLLDAIRLHWRTCLFVLLLVLGLAPLFLFKFLPFVHLPQWVYHAHLLQELRRNPDTVLRYFMLARAPVPNSGFDLLGWALGLVIPSPVAVGRVYVALAIAVFVCGASYLIRSVQGQPTVLEFLPLAWMYGFYTYFGLACFHLSLGLFLFSMGFLHRSTRGASALPSKRALAGLALLGALAYLAHLMGWAALVIAVATYCFLVCVRQRSARGLGLLLPLAPSLLMLGWYAVSRAGTVGSVPWPSWPYKLLNLAGQLFLFFRLDPFDVQVPAPFVLNTAVFGVVLTVVATSMDRSTCPRSALPVHAAPLVAGLACAAAALAFPYYFFGNSLTPGARLVQPAFWTALASVRYRPFRSRQLGFILILVLVGLVLVANAVQFERVQPLLTEISTVTGRLIPPGAHVFSVTLKNSPLWNACTWVPGSKGPIANLAFGMPLLRHFDVYRVVASGGNYARTFDTGLLVPRELDLPAEAWATERMRVDLDEAASTTLRDAVGYDFIELFGCPDDLRRMEALLVPAFAPVAQGTYFSVLGHK